MKINLILISRVSLFLSAVICIVLIAFFVLTKTAQSPIENLSNIYSNDELGFSVRLPVDWRGKYFITEIVGQNHSREIIFYDSRVAINPAKLFSIVIFSENDLKYINPKIYSEIKRSNMLIYTWKLGMIQPYSDDQLIKFKEWQNLVPSIVKTFALTGHYQYRSVRLYFGEKDNHNCSEVSSVKRVLNYVPDYEAETLRELFIGPNEGDILEGKVSVFSEKTKNILNKLIIKNKIAYIDLNDIKSIYSDGISDCDAQRFISEINNTLGQFSNIEKTVISLNGVVKDFYDYIRIDCPEGMCENN